MRKILVGWVALAFVAAACSVDLTGHSATSTDALPGDGALNGAAEPIATVVRTTLPAVVNVTTDVFQPGPFGNIQQGKGVGTGFIVRQDGIIVTNCHVVEGGSKITVSTSAQTPKQYDARVIGGDCQHDLAVLKIDATGLPTVPLGDSGALVLGQRVIAIGYALALEGGPTVTAGIVSSLDRTITVQDPSCRVCKNGGRVYSNVIQTDAAINHGNSGPGPYQLGRLRHGREHRVRDRHRLREGHDPAGGRQPADTRGLSRDLIPERDPCPRRPAGAPGPDRGVCDRDHGRRARATRRDQERRRDRCGRRQGGQHRGRCGHDPGRAAALSERQRRPRVPVG